MSLYSNYVEERTSKKVLETDRGFCIYEIVGKECYIEDIYTLPDFRIQGEASSLADKVAEIAKSQGCTHLTGTVAPEAKGAMDSLKVLLSYGMKLYKSTDDLIYFFKEIT